MNHTIFSSSHIGGKLLIQLICISGLLVLMNTLTGSDKWALNYIIPFLVDATTLLITLIIFRQRISWRSYVGFTLSIILIGFIPVLLYVFSIVTVLWPSIITALYSFLTFMAMLIFSDTIFKSDLIRRFHL